MQMYASQLNELNQNLETTMRFLKFIATNHKYTFDKQIQLAANPNANLIASYSQWYDLGRYVIKGEKAMIVWDFEKTSQTNYFDVSQTNGANVGVFDWQIKKTDQENLSTHWSLEKVPSFEKQLEHHINKQAENLQDLEIKKPVITCSKFLISQRLGTLNAKIEAEVLTALASSVTQNKLKAVIDQSQKLARIILWDIEKVLSKKYHKKLISYVKRINTRPNYLDYRTPRSTVRGMGNSRKPPKRSRSDASRATGNDWTSNPNARRGNRSQQNEPSKVRGTTLLSNQGAGKPRQCEVHGNRRSIDDEQKSTRRLHGESSIPHRNSQSSDAPSAPRSNNLLGDLAMEAFEGF